MDLGSVDWEASVARSKERCNTPTGRIRKLLDDLQESNHFWYALRRHGDVETCTDWLEKLREVSNYNRKSKYEEQKKEYLKFVDEVNRWEPGFRDQVRAMRSGSSINRSEPYETRHLRERKWFQRMCVNVRRRWCIDEEPSEPELEPE